MSDQPPNSSFSTIQPAMQLAWDSTSLGEFKTCARKYYYSIVQGWQPRGQSPHLAFGIWLHKAREQYEHLRAVGTSHEDALIRVVYLALTWTWNEDLNRGWVSDHPTKNRLTLIQTLVWYLDGIAQNDILETYRLANGRPAVELSFRFDSGFRTRQDEAILLCGHLDRIAAMGDDLWISDIKTSGHPLGSKFMAGFSPDNQMSLYTIAGKLALGVPVKGVIIDGIQVGANFARFGRAQVPRSESQSDEWLKDLQWWLDLAEQCAETSHWPMNEKSCGNYASEQNPGGCQFRPVCSRPPSARDLWLKSDYIRRVWDPLQVRGDI